MAPEGSTNRTALIGQAACRHAHDLGAAPACEGQREDDRAVPQTNWRTRHDVEQPVDLVAAQAAGQRLHDLWSLQRVAGIRQHDLHSYKKVIEAAEAGDAGTDGE